jgi:hypothetical protein
VLFARADKPSKAGRPLWWVAGLLLCALVAVIGFVVLNDDSKTAVLPPPEPSRSTAGVESREAAAAALLGKLSDGLSDGSRREVLSLAVAGDKAAARKLGDIYANVRRLRIADLEMRYVDEDAGALSTARQRALGGGAWVGDVQLSWRLKGYDAGESRMEVALTLVQTPSGAAFVSARTGSSEAAPLWLLSRVAVERSGRTLVMATDPADLPRFSALARRAVSDVDKVLPGWHGKLVAEVPSSEQQLNRILGSSAHEYDAIAAVTTTVDGSAEQSSPVHVFVNPQVFDPLGERGSQIVMSHEATHVATDAATASMPTWLLEGFADYVALAHVDLPVTVTASQVIGEVRKTGAPRHLPGPTDFDTENTALGASYEAAWLACRLIAEQHGEKKLITFYRRVDRGAGLHRAFREVLGTREQAFTKAWHGYLEDLAS